LLLLNQFLIYILKAEVMDNEISELRKSCDKMAIDVTELTNGKGTCLKWKFYNKAIFNCKNPMK